MWQFGSCLQCITSNFIDMMCVSMCNVYEIWKRMKFTFHRFFHRNRWKANKFKRLLIMRFVIFHAKKNNNTITTIIIDALCAVQKLICILLSLFLPFFLLDRCFVVLFVYLLTRLLPHDYVIVLWMNIVFSLLIFSTSWTLLSSYRFIIFWCYYELYFSSAFSTSSSSSFST